MILQYWVSSQVVEVFQVVLIVFRRSRQKQYHSGDGRSYSSASSQS